MLEFLFVIVLSSVIIYLALRSLPYFQGVVKLPAQPPPSFNGKELCSRTEAMKHAIRCEQKAYEMLKTLPEPYNEKLSTCWQELADEWWAIFEKKGGSRLYKI